MKIKIWQTALILSVFFTASCTPDSTSSNASQVVTSGEWRVTLFTDSGNDETSDFSGYRFIFNTGGTITAVNNAVSKTGTWSTGSSSNKFTIDLGAKTDTNKPLGELTDDWQIVSVSETVIQLKDDNAASNEKLTFTKN
jgi:hypothetical protein